MSEMNLGGGGASHSVQRADELFTQHRRKIYCSADQLFAQLMLVQWPAAILTAILVSPEAWLIRTAIFLGAAISLLPICLTRIRPGAEATRQVMAIAQVLMAALLIAVTGGRLETHVYVFVSLALLSLYRDWRVLVMGTLVITANHIFGQFYWPFFGYTASTAVPLLSTIDYVGCVILEGTFLVISCFLSLGEMRAMASRTAALEASEQGFRQFFVGAPIGMAVVGLDETLIKVNKRLCEMVGYTERELEERTTMDITFEEDIEQGRMDAEELLTGGPRSSVERRYVRKNGDTLWITRTAWLVRDVDGKPRNFLIMVEDISERKRAEKELRESKRELEAAHHANQLIMDNSQDVICTIDEAGRFATVNAACEQLWGYKSAELLRRHSMELVHPEDRAMTNQVREVLRLDGKFSDFVNRCVRKDGTIVDVLWSASWSESDKITFCVAHDVTDRARIEKELREAKEEADRANRAKSEFLSRMSHELRTPLNAILGFSQLLERQSPTEMQRPRITHIISAGRHLLSLINQVLDISCVDTGTLPLSLEPVNVADVLEGVLKLIRPLAAERGIMIDVPTPEEPCFVKADRQRLRQILLNLITNAVKYTPLDGKVAIFSSPRGANDIRIVVRDTGNGIPPEKMDRLFTPFDRLGAEHSQVQGTGLGLALCQRLVRAMQGLIGFNTTAGHGSTFFIELAKADPPAPVVPDGNDQGPAATSEENKRTILYVEDNVSNLTVVEQMLAEQPQFKLISAMLGQAGIEMARQHLPDLILLDLHLPDLHGREVLSRLRRDETTCEIPVVIISADATVSQIKRLRAEGARDYLTKPFEMQDFFRIINEASAPRIADAPVAA
jgi:PAS domain S-box-containing protein